MQIAMAVSKIASVLALLVAAMRETGEELDELVAEDILSSVRAGAGVSMTLSAESAAVDAECGMRLQAADVRDLMLQLHNICSSCGLCLRKGSQAVVSCFPKLFGDRSELLLSVATI